MSRDSVAELRRQRTTHTPEYGLFSHENCFMLHKNVPEVLLVCVEIWFDRMFTFHEHLSAKWKDFKRQKS